MNISPIQLKFYSISRLLIVPQGEVSLNPPTQPLGLCEWSGVSIQTNIEFGWGDASTEESKPFAQRLGLIINNETGAPAPYKVDIELIGYFDLVGKIPTDLSAQDLAQVNAAAMLYSSMRELIFSTTIRFPRGPMVLPGVNFLDLKSAKPAPELSK
jgi:preprotein translocase subunit SecB